MKNTLKVCTAIILGLAAIFGLIVAGNVVFAYIGNTNEELSAGQVWEQSFQHTVRNLHITDYFEPDYDPEEYNVWAEIRQEFDSESAERNLEFRRDNWNIVNSSMNKELLEGTKEQYIELVSAQNGNKVIEDVVEVSALVESMHTDDWDVVSEMPDGLTSQYELVVYQQVDWPTGAKMEEIGRYTIYEDSDFVKFHFTIMPIGVSDICLIVPGAVAEMLHGVI